MHHAYPRECPYPHGSGTTKPQSVTDYVAQSQRSPVVSQSQMHAVVEAAKALEAREEAEDGGDECTAWSHQEELYVGDHRTFAAPAPQAGFRALRPFVYAAVVAAALVTLLQRSKACAESVMGSSSKKIAAGG